MRLGLLGVTVFAVLAPGVMTAAEPEKATVELRSDLLVSGLPFAECATGVYGVRLTAQVDKKGEGRGTLELEPNAPAFDELGWQTTGSNLPPVKLECALKLVKKKKIRLPESPRIAAPLVEVEWALLEIHGPKITSRLFLATEDKCWGAWARLLVHDKDGKVRYAVHLKAPPPPQPCHPGCFPAGTPIRTPGGSQPIERLREGDPVTTVSPDGAAAPGKVLAVFATKNRLVAVRTEAGDLVTTETQPLALVGGGFRAAGALKAGDRVFRWDGRERRAVTVRSVSLTGREEPVFNLILGAPAVFVADGFLVRSKPPSLASPVRAEGLAPDVFPVRARD
jgi:hypothetical protein